MPLVRDGNVSFPELHRRVCKLYFSPIPLRLQCKGCPAVGPEAGQKRLALIGKLNETYLEVSFNFPVLLVHLQQATFPENLKLVTLLLIRSMNIIIIIILGLCYHFSPLWRNPSLDSFHWCLSWASLVHAGGSQVPTEVISPSCFRSSSWS